MPIKVHTLQEGEGVEIVATGAVTGDEIIAAHSEIYGPENLRRQRFQIIDRSECTEYQVSQFQVRQIAELDRAASEINPDIVIAVVSATDLQFGVSRMWKTHLETCTFTTQVFRDRGVAEKWVEEQLLARPFPDTSAPDGS